MTLFSKEEGPYCPSSSAAEEATVRSPLLTFRVTKIKFGKTKDASGKSVNDKSTVIYNEFITLKGIPLSAYDYVVNGKPALEWVMERQSVTTDKDSGITNDANLWATETIGNPKYPLELFLRVVTVGLETMKVVNKWGHSSRIHNKIATSPLARLCRACPRPREFLWHNALASEKNGYGSPKRLPYPKFEAYDLVTTLNSSSNCDHLHLSPRPSSSTSLHLWPA